MHNEYIITSRDGKDSWNLEIDVDAEELSDELLFRFAGTKKYQNAKKLGKVKGSYMRGAVEYALTHIGKAKEKQK